MQTQSANREKYAVKPESVRALLYTLYRKSCNTMICCKILLCIISSLEVIGSQRNNNVVWIEDFICCGDYTILTSF